MPLGRHLVDAFGGAAPDHLHWQFEAPVAAAAQRALVRATLRPMGRRVHDLGSAEGGTLRHLGGPDGAVGLDLIPVKWGLASSQVRARRVGRHFGRCAVPWSRALHRVLFHPWCGALDGARHAGPRRAAARLAGWVLPRSDWACVHVRGQDPR